MAERVKTDRPISAQEAAVVRAALERAPVAPEYSTLAASLEALHVVGQCSCGCDSIDFERHDPGNPSKPIADGVGTTPAGGTVGVIAWGRANTVTGLEVYDLGAGENDQKLPIPGSIRPFPKGVP